MSTTVLIIIIVVVVVVVIAALAGFAGLRGGRAQRERQEQAREEYGPEFDREAEEQGSEKKAEKQLRERRERVENETKPLSEESRRRYDERWEEVERTFVDNPARALDDADGVVGEMLKERNFPSGSRDEASKGVGVSHPQVVEDFREAQEIHHKSATGSGHSSTGDDERGSGESERSDESGSGGSEADLESMRQAIQKYRSVYKRLRED